MMPSRGVITHKMIPLLMAMVCFMGLTLLLSIWNLNYHVEFNDLIISFGESDGLFLQQSNKETLRFDFYREECPEAEMIVWASVNRVMAEETRAPAQLLRLMFHDCFIQGCDASVLLAASGNDSTVERQAIPNQTLKGFDYIESIKQELERACPGVVSCADIIVLATRDGIAQTSGPFYPVLTGRRDSIGSFFDEAMAEIPRPNGNISETLRLFGLRGFTARETVALLGGHNIGKIGCEFIEPRASDNFLGTGQPDPTISSDIVRELRGRCRVSRMSGGGGDISAGTGGLDSHYYRNLIKGRGLLYADNQLMFDDRTAGVVREYASDAFAFRRDFARAMVKLSSLPGGAPGEVRLNCNRPNEQNQKQRVPPSQNPVNDKSASALIKD